MNQNEIFTRNNIFLIFILNLFLNFAFFKKKKIQINIKTFMLFLLALPKSIQIET